MWGKACPQASETHCERNALRDAAFASGLWSYVEPAYLTPTWVHFDKRLFPPACPAGGYITVRRGSVGVYVLVLQDALNAIGFGPLSLDGVFGGATQSAVHRFQVARSLAADAIVGCATWTALTRESAGIGRTPGVLT